MENELNEMFTDWYPETPISYDFDNINKQKIAFLIVLTIAATVGYEICMAKGIEYVVNSYKNKKLETSIKKTIKQPENILSFYQAKDEKVKE